jgi:hypothetical protein
VTLGANGAITAIDSVTPRRLVAGTGCLSWKCIQIGPIVDGIRVGGKSYPFEELTAAPIELRRDEIISLELTGSGFVDGMRVDLGPGVNVKMITVQSDSKAAIQAEVAHGAVAGLRDIVVMLPDCVSVFRAGVFKVATLPSGAGAPREVAAGTEPGATPAKPKAKGHDR